MSVTNHRSSGVLLALLLTGMLLLTGCSSSPQPEVATADDPAGSVAPSPGSPDRSDADADPSDAAATDSTEQELKFLRCLRRNGVEVPDNIRDVGPGQLDLNTQEFRDAVSQCEDEVPAVGELGPGLKVAEEQQSQFLSMAECMRDEGVEVPDPKFDADGQIQLDGLAGINPLDPEVQAALRTCSAKLDFNLLGGTGN